MYDGWQEVRRLGGKVNFIEEDMRFLKIGLGTERSEQRHPPNPNEF